MWQLWGKGGIKKRCWEGKCVSERNRDRDEPRYSNTFKVYYTNSWSQKQILNAFACTETLDIIAITETWINVVNRELLAEYQIKGLKLFYADR